MDAKMLVRMSSMAMAAGAEGLSFWFVVLMLEPDECRALPLIQVLSC
jgi:hypothetical protein